MTDTAPKNLILVVSDLHLGDGDVLEDFTCDDAFVRFLRHYGRRGNVRLILNGDTIDFLQTQPLGTLTVQGAIDKIPRVCAHHSATIGALGEFSRAGNRITVVEGNHDIEFLFPAVQEQFRRSYVEAGGEAERMEFVRLEVKDIPGVHIEHGHQVDSLNSFDYDALFLNAQTQTLRHPWGSRFVLRVFNNVEPQYSFIDKIRGEFTALLVLYTVDRGMFLTMAIPALGLTAESWLDRLRVASLSAISRFSKGREDDRDLSAWAADWSDILDTIETAEQMGDFAEAGDHAKGKRMDAGLRRLILHLQNSAEKKLLGDGLSDVKAAREIADRTGADTVIFGHTHFAGNWDIGGGRSYLNSGTWTPLLRIPEPETGEAWLAQLRSRQHYPVSNRPSYVKIERDGETTRCSLQFWEL